MSALSVNKTTTSTNCKKGDKLLFKFLPDYAQFLLTNKLEELIAEQLRLSREVKIPLLKYFESFTENELLELSRKSYKEFLTALIENKIGDHLAISMKNWKDNQLPLVTRDQIVADDITLVSFVRKKTLLKFLPDYTTDPGEIIELIQELDQYILQSEAESIRLYVDIQQEQIKENAGRLKMREEEYLEAQEIANLGSFVWDLAGHNSTYTAQVHKIFEMDKFDNLDSFLQYVHPSDRSKIQEAIERAINKDGIYECEYRFIKNKKEKVIWSRGVVTFKEGKPLNMRGTIMDVTDKHAMISDLQQSDRFYKEAQALAHIGNWSWDIQQNSLSWTDEIYRIYELEPQSKITFEDIFSFNHPDDRSLVSGQMQKSRETQQPHDFYYRIILKQGKIKTLHAKGQVLTDENGSVYKMFGTLQDVTEQKLIEKELRDNQTFIRKIADTTPSLIAVYNINTGKYIFISQALKTLLGYDPQEALQEGTAFFLKLIHPDDVASLMESNSRALETANSVESYSEDEDVLPFQYRLRHKNGEYRWFKTYGTVFDRNRENKVEHVLNISIDITEEYLLRKQLEEEKALAEMITESDVNRILAFDTDFRYIIWNQQCEKYYGKTKEEVLGKSAFDLFPQYQNNHLLPYVKRALAGESVHVKEEKFVFGDGIGEMFFIPLKKDREIFGVLCIIHDITEIISGTNKLTEVNKTLQIRNEELRKSEERFHKMIDEVQDYAILLLGPDGIIQNWNKGAEKIKGYKAEEIVGKNFRIFYTEEDRKAQVPEKLIGIAHDKGKATSEGWRVRKDGTTFWGSIVITALHDEENRIIGFTKVTRDLTERKSAEDKLLNYAMQLDKKNKELESSNKELTSFSYVASHDLQEPLRKIQTFGNRILEKEFEHLSESGKEIFKRMISASERMQKLIEDLLAFSRTHTYSQNFEPVDLNLVLDEVKSLQKEVIEEKKVTIESDNLPVISGIAFQMQQLFDNLIGNSIKYCDPEISPFIKITSKIVDRDKLKAHALAGEKNYYRISIKDNGIGFDQKHSNKIFEIFQRLHGKSQYPGTGIGLAICKKIVENHFGFIEAKSKEGDGATFTIYLPVTPPAKGL